MRILTKEQVKILKQNENIRRCSCKSISYKKKFKEEAIRLYNEEGLAATEIFTRAGIDLDIIGKRVPNRLMYQWKMSLMPGEKIKRFKPQLSEEVKAENNINRLKSRIAYLEAENDFLAKIRAGKRKSS
jgi:transposase-like protein